MPQIAASIEVLLVGTRKGGSEMPSAGPQRKTRLAADEAGPQHESLGTLEHQDDQ